MKTGWVRSVGDFFVSLGRSAWQSFRRWSWKQWAAVIVAGAALIVGAVLVDVPSLAVLRSWSEHLGPWFVVAFTGAYVFFTQFPIPRTVWTLAAGLLFGPWLGLAISLVALTISATVSLLIVRSLLGEWIRPHLTHPAVYAINARLDRRGWLAVASLRMVAGVPFSLLNYVAALTPISVTHFSVATLIGSIPTTAIGVFFGDALTGSTSPYTIVAFLLAAALGAVGLILDTRLPLAPGTRGSVKRKG
ncbi:TVP38/TMEM64 family protein [Corynebacterium sp. Marseille-Q2823]|uniref:TVP38/TMEM64 family protein n=1 Tax=Corynebacterium sp. Marseille-Q2823 TaxID=2736606 RepID=UPI00158F427A|nr:TVP38/TMEM64 family protein [Corynebacterium sp. Marseille-Q2823]